MSRRPAGALVAVAALGALAGCPHRAPAVETPILRLERIERDGDRLRLHLAIAGRDVRPVALDALDWSIGPDGAPRRGRLRLDGRLAAGERRAVVVTVGDDGLAAGAALVYAFVLHARGEGGPLASFLDDAAVTPPAAARRAP